MTNPVIFTMTLANDQAEAHYLAKCLRTAAEHAKVVIVGDAGRPLRMKEYLDDVPNIVVYTLPKITAGSLVAQIKLAIRHLPKPVPDFVLYSEPDKLEFFKRGLPQLLSEAKPGPRTGIVLAARNKRVFSTFPPKMHLTESLTNSLVGTWTKVPGDYCYGPMLIRTELLQILSFEKRLTELVWGWRFLVMGCAYKLGLRFQHVWCAAGFPRQQRKERNDLYRLKQMGQNIKGFHRGVVSLFNPTNAGDR